MSIDKSLRRKNTLLRARSVLKRDERIKTLVDTERWADGRSPYGLPKVRVLKIAAKKKAPKEKAADAVAGAEGGAAPAAAAPAAGAKPGAKPAAKPAGKK